MGLTEEQDPHPRPVRRADRRAGAARRRRRPAGRDAAVRGAAAPRVRLRAGVSTNCAQCGRLPAPGTDLYYSSGSGGVICRDCEPHLIEKRRLSHGRRGAAAPVRRRCDRNCGRAAGPAADGTCRPRGAEACEVMQHHFQHLLGARTEDGRGFLAGGGRGGRIRRKIRRFAGLYCEAGFGKVFLLGGGCRGGRTVGNASDISIEVWGRNREQEAVGRTAPATRPVNRIIAVLVEKMSLPRHSPDGPVDELQVPPQGQRPPTARRADPSPPPACRTATSSACSPRSPPDAETMKSER